jgi:PAS domain S-box-containing protein
MIFKLNRHIRKLTIAYLGSVIIIACLLIFDQLASGYAFYSKSTSSIVLLLILLILTFQIFIIFRQASKEIAKYLQALALSNEELSKSLAGQQDLEKELRRKATELASMNEVLQVGEERFRKLIEYNTVGIFIHDGQNIVYANPECTKILGYNMFQLFTTPLIHIVHPDFRPTIERKLSQMRKMKMKKTMTFRTDIHILDSQGKSRWIDMSTSNAYEKSSFIATISDITERKLANDQLQEANKLIEKRNEQLNQVLTQFKKQQEELIKQSEDLSIANEAISKSQEELEKKNKIIERKNEDILASINYAKRIQQAILPTSEEINRAMTNYFILYKPLDIVSGDFYWVTRKHYKTIIAVVDCTGHGIPGAFMSLIGNDLLNEIVNTRSITSPELILEELRKDIQKVLRQGTTLVQDGMDIAICTIDHFPEEYKEVLGKPKLEFAGAGNPIVFIQNNEMKYVRGDNIPIGGYHPRHTARRFIKHSFLIEHPTTFYLFTDGYQDQFGVGNNGKFGTRKLRELLFQIHQEPMHEQKEILEKTITDWLHESHRQIDDILLMGVKLE